MFRQEGIEIVRTDQTENRVAEELQPLVALPSRLVRIGGMGQGMLEQLDVLEAHSKGLGENRKLLQTFS